MRNDAYCESCRRRCASATTNGGDRILLDPAPRRDGNVYVVGYEKGLRVVEIAGSAEEVPGSQPLRYNLHLCGR